MAFLFRLKTLDGVPAEPATLNSAVPNWSASDMIHLGKRTLRVIGKWDDAADRPPILIVEEECTLNLRAYSGAPAC
jgi:hypothetical protein